MEVLTNGDIVRHIMLYADIRSIMNMRMVARIDDALNANFWFNRFARDDYVIIIVKLPENALGWIREYLTMSRYYEELMELIDYAIFVSYKFTDVDTLTNELIIDKLDKNICPYSMSDYNSISGLKYTIKSIKKRTKDYYTKSEISKLFSYLSISKENRIWKLELSFRDIDNIRIIITGWDFIKPVLTPI